MDRLIQTQREAARNSIYSKLATGISKAGRDRLDALLETDEATYSPIHYLKQPPGNLLLHLSSQLTQALDQNQGNRYSQHRYALGQ